MTKKRKKKIFLFLRSQVRSDHAIFHFFISTICFNATTVLQWLGRLRLVCELVFVFRVREELKGTQLVSVSVHLSSFFLCAQNTIFFSVIFLFPFSFVREHSDGNNDTISLSVYFHQATMVKYRTDVVLDWLDLIGLCEKTIFYLSHSPSHSLTLATFHSNAHANQLCKLPLKFPEWEWDLFGEMNDRTAEQREPRIGMNLFLFRLLWQAERVAKHKRQRHTMK